MRDAHVGLSDAECVALVRAGDPSARASLVSRHHASCLRFARHVLGDDADAEDAVQETFVRALAALARYEERDAFRGWLFQILVHRCRSLAAGRTRRRERIVSDERALERAAVPGDERMQDAQRALATALEGLDLDHREAFLLKVGEEMEYDEMSRLTGVQVSALKMRVKRARDHVRARWPGANDGG
jgi:RNA polymerase sigma-70 factor (ECF subfamily)